MKYLMLVLSLVCLNVSAETNYLNTKEKVKNLMWYEGIESTNKVTKETKSQAESKTSPKLSLELELPLSSF